MTTQILKTFAPNTTDSRVLMAELSKSPITLSEEELEGVAGGFLRWRESENKKKRRRELDSMSVEQRREMLEGVLSNFRELKKEKEER